MSSWQPEFLYLSTLASYPTDPQATFLRLLTVTAVVTYTLPSQFLLDICNQSSPHPCSWGSIDSFDVLFLTLSEGNRDGLVGQCLQVHSGVQYALASTATHRSLTASTKQVPVLQAPFMVGAPYRWTIFYLYSAFFTVPFVGLDK